jgi:hypothetical protein
MNAAVAAATAEKSGVERSETEGERVYREMVEKERERKRVKKAIRKRELKERRGSGVFYRSACNTMTL